MSSFSKIEKICVLDINFSWGQIVQIQLGIRVVEKNCNFMRSWNLKKLQRR